MPRTEIERHGDAVIFRDDALRVFASGGECAESEMPFATHFGRREGMFWVTWEDETPTQGPFASIEEARAEALPGGDE